MCLQRGEKGQRSGHSNRLPQELERLQVLDPRFKRRRSIFKQALGPARKGRTWRARQRGPRCQKHGHRRVEGKYVQKESGADDGANYEGD